MNHKRFVQLNVGGGELVKIVHFKPARCLDIDVVRSLDVFNEVFRKLLGNFILVAAAAAAAAAAASRS